MLSRSGWAAGELRHGVQELVAQRLGAPEGFLIVDNTGFLNKGVVSLGVRWPCSGMAGRTAS
ncbi:transposase [Streptomyces sp. NPDC059627]